MNDGKSKVTLCLFVENTLKQTAIQLQIVATVNKLRY